MSKNTISKCLLNTQFKEEKMEFLKNLAALIKVKTLVTLAVMAVFTNLAVTGKISADNVMIIVSTVIAFYFGTQSEKKG